MNKGNRLCGQLKTNLKVCDYFSKLELLCGALSTLRRVLEATSEQTLSCYFVVGNALCFKTTTYDYLSW